MATAITWSAIVAFLLLILFLPIRVTVRIREKVSVRLYILCFSKQLFPQKEKQPNPRDFRIGALRRWGEKLKKKLAKKKKAARKKAKAAEKKKAQRPQSRDIAATLRLTKRLLQTVLGRAGKYFKIKIRRCTIRLSTGDAAQTAILYGAVSAALNQMLFAMRQVGMVEKHAKKHIRLIADFSGRPPAFSADIHALTCPLRAAALAIKAGFLYLDWRRKKLSGETEEQRRARMQSEREAQKELAKELLK